jgi:hypothetical protein
MSKRSATRRTGTIDDSNPFALPPGHARYGHYVWIAKRALPTRGVDEVTPGRYLSCNRILYVFR